MRWLLAFAFTQAIEIPIYLRALRGRRGALPIAFGASAVTHPVVWFLMPGWWSRLYLLAIVHDPRFVVASPAWRYATMVLMAETFAIVVEAVYLRAFGVRRALTWSLLANVASTVLGLVCRALVGVP